MAQVIVNVFYNVLLTIADVILTPISLVFESLFPNLHYYILIVINFINDYIGGGISWFLHFLPLGVIQTLSFCVDTIIALYTISLTVFIIVKILNIIHKVKVVG